ncbi:transketolase family protein [Tianweitania sediminis]|jgi:transketolase|uniref:Transketolase n=1 Tax=Tianweitania sediminis TaxID=1502156 RepID=A0A8J7UMT1_9HYPH|nr:transketolase C-terminal domain-containing protein [Tianweitania sediminis]MBP0440722.1 transketolase [Tianweitania sediminis]HEV7416484.1 transketolase C-terminal domain-containing protein [Tianweitania sediminis]
MGAAGQDQSTLFRGDDAELRLKDAKSVRGTPARTMPAFILGEELADLADHDPRIVVATADLANSSRTRDFANRHPDRFIDFGIAERNMITAAAGMASCGLVPYVATFASFAGILAAEAIKTDCAYPRMPVRVIGHHSGISMGFYGTSHHSTEDLGMMRPIADLTVVCAADANQLRAILRASVDHPGAMYIRLGRGRDAEVYSTVPDDFAFGRATQLRDGRDLTIIATGSQVHASLAAADRLAEQGRSVRVLDMHTIKPLDEQAIRAAARETKAILTVEEHNVIGGLGSAVAEVLVSEERKPFRRHGILDEFSLIGPPAALYAHYKLDADGVTDVANGLLKEIN